jgi:hypothetical protein
MFVRIGERIAAQRLTPGVAVAVFLTLAIPAVMAHGAAWWFALPMVGALLGREVAVAYWQCCLLACVPYIGRGGWLVLVGAWLGGLFLAPNGLVG